MDFHTKRCPLVGRLLGEAYRVNKKHAEESPWSSPSHSIRLANGPRGDRRHTKRPTTHILADIDDEEALTPSHLLNGHRITLLPCENVNEEDINDSDYGNLTTITKRARRMVLLLQHFRNRWKNEYLTSLREFHRTTGKNKQTINIGDVVLVHDDKPRIKWKLAVIENLTEGKDGYVRSADIRTTNGKTNRPIAKLYPLEVRATTAAEYPIEIEQPVTPIENTRELQTKRPIRMAARNALQ